MKSKIGEKVTQRMMSLAVAFFMVMGSGVLSYGQVNPTPSASATTVVAVVPLCLASIGETKNAKTIKAAEDLTTTLAKEQSLTLLTQNEIMAAFTSAGFVYKDTTGKTLAELIKALPRANIVIFLGPYPEEGQFFNGPVVRASDGVGKSFDVLPGDDGDVSLPLNTIGKMKEEIVSLMKPAKKE